MTNPLYEIKELCGECKSQKKTLIAVNLVRGAQDYKTAVVQCNKCGHHSYTQIRFDVMVGELHEG